MYFMSSTAACDDKPSSQRPTSYRKFQHLMLDARLEHRCLF